MEQLSQLFIEAGTLMLAGMVFVFVFLGLLVVIINSVLSPLAERFPDPVASTSKANIQPKTNQPSVHQGISPKVVAAISAAVSQYRKQHKE